MTKQKSSTQLQKTPTGIHGLDEIANGGLPKGRTALVSGNEGSCKTILPDNPIELIGGMQSVRFEFTDPTATTVCVAGSFNDWDPGTKPMAPFRNGGWMKETSLAPGAYEYCLVVDGKYIPDPLALETVPNPFGGRNSVLKVYGSQEESHLDRAEHAPLENRNRPTE